MRNDVNDAEWKEDVALLDRTHKALRIGIERLPRTELTVSAAGGKVTNFELIAGIAAHDVYHAGQIQLIKRLLR